ncbi:LysR family transcriptional regulator [Rhodococcus pyridinivorans]|uniref:LysR family transcriptional regulator n=1 Tax=Rhodococcus pyridinivorans TaxID=103816 RepID=UPI002078A46B|nr:LysR family transcriptional regulator [Rhodococcus pyridinivorans]USI93002.1 LysR family transcriptional regulator [Rhodococcus pyridinivorans]
MHSSPFTLRQLEYFVAAAELGTITAAAQSCFVSQTAVSLGIAELERVLGVQLLMRQRAKGIALTPAGRRLIRDARALLGEAEQLSARAAEDSAGLSGSFGLGCFTTLSPFILGSLMIEFTRQFPHVSLDIQEDDQPMLSEALLAGNLDVAILYDHLLPDGLDRVPVLEARPHVLLPTGHSMADQPTVSLVELAREPMVLIDVSPSRENWAAMVNSLGISPQIGIRTRSFELTRCLVSEGFGYAVLLQRPMTTTTYTGSGVVVKEIREDVAPRRIIAAYPSELRSTKKIETFVDFARAHMPQH